MSDITYYLYMIPAVLLALVLHEFAHGYVSYRLGDPTPAYEGRLTLNPLKHIDPIGTLCMVLFRVGFAKPVRICPAYYKNPKTGSALVSLAGPFTNLITGSLSIFVMTLISFLAYKGVIPGDSELIDVVYVFLYYFSIVSINLCVFNLIPLPPLDGSKVLGIFLPDRIMYFFNKYHNVCTFILLALIYTGFLNSYLSGAFNLLYGAIEDATYAVFMRFI